MTSSGRQTGSGAARSGGPRRDRHGRGVRGPLAWPAVPAMATRRQQFDDLVLDSAARLEERLGPRFQDLVFAVEDVPATDPPPWESENVAFGRVFPSRGRQPARIVIYRRPIEARAENQRELTAIVQDVVVEQVAALFGLPPAELDPRYDGEA